MTNKRWVMLWVFAVTAFWGKSAVSSEEKDYIPPALTPQPYLIRDPAVRRELNLTEEQTVRLDARCQEMDEHLFALRDQPPNPTEPDMLEHVRAVVEAMKGIDEIIQPTQRRRLQELSFQFEGIYTLFRPAPAAYLGLTEEQKKRMQTLHRQFLRNQERLQQRLEETGRQQETSEQTEQLRVRFLNQFFQILSEGQRVVWQEMLGEPFDFSRTQPLSFRAPSLEGSTGWLNSKPLNFKQMEGRVVIVIFSAVRNPDCLGDLPIYQLWARQYPPQEVSILMILVPQSEAQKDIAQVRSYVHEHGLTFPVAVDSEGKAKRTWANPVLPGVYLVDKHGRVRWWWYGPLQSNNGSGERWVAERVEILRAEAGGP